MQSNEFKVTGINVDDVIRYESGEMGRDEAIEFFQSLVNTGMAWKLQGHYGRTAMALVESGHVTVPENQKH